MLSEYPADFLIYKGFPNTSFEGLKGTCRTKNATIWDIDANQLNQMPGTWINTPYFMTTLRQRGSVPEEFTNNQEDCIIVYKDKFKRIHIDQN